MTKRKKVFLCTISILLIFAIILCYLVYNGFILLNHPSKKNYPVVGADVSHYQGTINWDMLADQGLTFAYIKATEGSSHVDECFVENWQQAKDTALKIGAYHFFSFDSPGESQAEHFISNVENYEGMLPPTVDVEYYADKKNNPPNVEDVQRELESFIDRVQKHYDMPVVIYSTEEVWNAYLKGYFDENPIWIRNVITRPKIEEEWTFWQYTNRGRLKGFSGDEEFIDLNVFCGDKNEWELWIKEGAGQ